MPHAPRHSTESDIQALEQVCERLAGFGVDVSVEWVDGFLTAVAASRRAIPVDEWLPLAFDDAFERAFADPADSAQALAVLTARTQVLASQLDVDAMLEQPEQMRLGPLMITLDDAARAEVVAAGHMDAQEALDTLQTGALWAEGFFAAVEALGEDWPEPDTDTEGGRWYDSCLTRVSALLLPQAELATYLAEEYPGDTLARDQLVDEACYAVQDLRVYFLEHAPKPETRRVAPQPGRNDPCPCGSGKKYKKCHGAA